MRAIETVHAENRDQIDSPVYRVNFWQQGQGWLLDAHVLFDAQDVGQALDWANQNSRGRQFELFVEMDCQPESKFSAPREAGLVRLFGTNPNEGEAVTIGYFVRD